MVSRAHQPLVGPNARCGSAEVVEQLRRSVDQSMREWRIVVGECAIALHWAARALDSLRARLTQYGGGFFATAQRAKPYDDLEQVGPEMDTLAEQLAVTLGREHEAVVAFGGARAAMSDIVETVGLLKDPQRHEMAVPQKFVDQTIARVQDQRERFDAWRDQFMAAARDAPGED